MSGCSNRAASNDVEGKPNKLRMCQAKGVAENVPVPGTKPSWPAQDDAIRPIERVPFKIVKPARQVHYARLSPFC
jgi:hypothetical protein